MTMDRDLDRVLAQYFEDGPTKIADRVVTSALETIDHTPQARLRLRLPRRLTMQHPLWLAAVPVSAVIVVAVAAGLLNQNSPPPIAATPSPGVATVSPSASASASASASPGSSVTPAPPAAGPPLIAYIHRETDPVSGILTYEWHVWTVEPDGSNRQRLNADISVDPTVLAWSPDGSRVLAYAQGFPNIDPETSPGVYAFDVVTGSATQLSACVAPCYRDDPELSADGSTLLVVRRTADANGEPAESFLVSIDLATGRETEIPGTRLDNSPRSCGDNVGCSGPWMQGPSLSPDGRRIAVGVMEEVGVAPDEGFVSTRAHMVVMNRDGSNARTLDLGGLSAGDPRWSPDGARILFSSYIQDYPGVVRIRRDVYTVAADGGGLRRLTKDGHSTGATWTSVGRIRFIRFGREGAGGVEVDPNFWIMDADGSNARQLTDFRASDWGWSTPSLSYPNVGWRPDPPN